MTEHTGALLFQGIMWALIGASVSSIRAPDIRPWNSFCQARGAALISSHASAHRKPFPLTPRT